MIVNETGYVWQKAFAEALKEYRINDYREPEKYLGPFDALPLEIQQAISGAIADEDRWTMAGRGAGWQVGLTRLFSELRRSSQDFQ